MGDQEEDVDGLLWTPNEDIQKPLGLAEKQKTTIKPEFRENRFTTPLDSLLAFLPLPFWERHLNETNKYAAEYKKQKNKKRSEQKKLRSEKIHGINFQEITVTELFHFYAILFQFAVRPHPGLPYVECFNYKDEWYPACQKMTPRRFKLIRSLLHWNDNDGFEGTTDSLYKIRPLLNFVSLSLGSYLDVGDSLALDETTVGMRSRYAKAVTYFDRSKPKGKYHLKFYALCENTYGNAIAMKMCYRQFNPEYGYRTSRYGKTTNHQQHSSIGTQNVYSDNSGNDNKDSESDNEINSNDSCDHDNSIDDAFKDDDENNLSKKSDDNNDEQNDRDTSDTGSDSDSSVQNTTKSKKKKKTTTTFSRRKT